MKSWPTQAFSESEFRQRASSSVLCFTWKATYIFLSELTRRDIESKWNPLKWVPSDSVFAAF